MELATQTQAYTTKHDVLQIMMILRDKKIYKKINIAQVQILQKDYSQMN